ncbi:MAG TPA: alpha-glucuronidase family glycosyl hydrolase, partial [Longimicrobiales bacterium]
MKALLRPLWLILVLALAPALRAEDGYELWLRYRLVSNAARLAEYRGVLQRLVVQGSSPTLGMARDELVRGLRGLLGRAPALQERVAGEGVLVLGTPASSPYIASLGLGARLQPLGDEGYLIRSFVAGGRRITIVSGNSDVAVLYGTFELLRRLQVHATLSGLDDTSAPAIHLRLLDHWDNLNGTIERGYAGHSLWQWDSLPGRLSSRYGDYARANASIGINGTVLTNVNANARVLTAEYLPKVAALASVFRPYGIKVYLTARYSAPVEIGGLKTADPLDPGVREWWKAKADEIYKLIPDFGGFLVKANSEGQPGPQDYKRTHADGANMLADAVGPHGGVVMWRAFVYSSEVPTDRIRQAYDEFHPLDGQFRPNVFVQVKNGPLDFQPREPFSPLFGGMPNTPVMMELQVTKEYLGQRNSLVFLAPMWQEVLGADTYARGPGSTVAQVIDGRLYGGRGRMTGIAGVANVGDDRNWCGSDFNQANWYAFGRLAW